jgi:hypothetical protein
MPPLFSLFIFLSLILFFAIAAAIQLSIRHFSRCHATMPIFAFIVYCRFSPFADSAMPGHYAASYAITPLPLIISLCYA